MITVGITGASGMLYAVRLLEYLGETDVGVNLVVSEPGWGVLAQELSWDIPQAPERRAWVKQRFGEKVTLYANDDWSSPVASGSAKSAGMVIIPCSMGSLGRIASGVSASLIERGADVCLKEGRKLILVVRETPFNLIHLDNMSKLARAGAVIMPAAPGFYHHPQTLQDIVDFMVGRVLDQLGVKNPLVKPWGEI